MFHVTNGLFFQKLDGSVKIIKRESAEADAPVLFELGSKGEQ